MAEWEGIDPEEWAMQSKARMTAVYRTSADKMADRLRQTRANGGRLPHVTGNLMRSLRGSTAGPINVHTGEQEFTSQDVGLVIAGLQGDQDLWLGYQAAYARRVNSGFVGEDSLGRLYMQEGAHFVEDAMAMWGQFVKESAREVQNKVMSRG